MNEKPETTNYIENAIKFKNLQDRQKINQTGDKLLLFGPDKLPNVTSVTQSNSSMGRTYQSLSRSLYRYRVYTYLVHAVSLSIVLLISSLPMKYTDSVV